MGAKTDRSVGAPCMTFLDTNKYKSVGCQTGKIRMVTIQCSIFCKAWWEGRLARFIAYV